MAPAATPPASLDLSAEPLAPQGTPQDAHNLTVPDGIGLRLHYRMHGCGQAQLRVRTRSAWSDEGPPHTAPVGQIDVTPAGSCVYQLVGSTNGAEVCRSQEVTLTVAGDSNLFSGTAYTLPPPGDAQLGDLPFLLCGPMLRSVQPWGAAGQFRVCVFVATSQPCRIQLRLFEGTKQASAIGAQGPGGATELGTAPSVPTRPFGPQLHVALLVREELALTLNHPYSYDLYFQLAPAPGPEGTPAATDPPFDLLDLGLLDENSGVGYGHGTLPGFVAPPAQLDQLRLLHGSCRKPHAAGFDALAIADDLLARKPHSEAIRDDPTPWPHQLVLTGDQIYADEVAPCLLDILRVRASQMLAPELLAGGKRHFDKDWLESLEIRSDNPEGKLDFDFLDSGKLRADVFGALSSLEQPPRPGHLLFLGEFFAMYLATWSPALWPVDAAGLPTLLPFRERIGPGSNRQELTDRKRVAAFAARLHQARRVLANVPTWMVGDDHEVTNNWNVHRLWVEGARKNRLTRRLLRNALAAYFVFQDWGNRPELYEEGQPGRPILDALTLVQPATPADPGLPAPAPTPAPLLQDPGLLDGLLLPPAEGTATGGTLGLSYAVEFPTHQLIVLDTRTRRAYRPAEQDPRGKSAARLIDSASLRQQLAPPSPDKLALVVSAVPVITARLAELVLAAAGLEIFLGPDGSDHEHWAYHPEAFFDLLGQLADQHRVVVLSGDVHYAYTAVLSLDRGGEGSSDRSRIVQLCSSALCNQDWMTQSVSAAADQLELKTPRALKDSRVQAAWTLHGLPHLNETGWREKTLRELETAAEALARGPARAAMAGRGALLKAVGDEPATGFYQSALRQLHLLARGPGAGALAALREGTNAWKVQIDFLRDPESGGLVSGAAAEALRRVNGSGTRSLVGFNNVGLVRFEGSNEAPTKVFQTLLWNLHGKHPPNLQADPTLELDPLAAVAQTVHEAPLTPPAENEVA